AEEGEKRKIFVGHLAGATNQLELFGRTFESFTTDMVAVEAETFGGKTGESITCLCVRGFGWTNKDVNDFHNVVSRRLRRQYQPWRLCYDLRAVRSAGVASPTYLYSTQSDEFHDGIDTLCETLLQTTHHGLSWTSTIGGIVEIDHRLFALTTRQINSKQQITKSQ
ncbi:hypothetical protein, partial [Erythrobacter sp. YJ-T3-07]|uniref:hypothetical protein n=1 Tax=Erythrobacter sp. YJ-T3-07 TaxID=2793063 RepID=UPI001F483ED7